MKIRDLLVILFTATVALIVLVRAAFADGIRPTSGAESACPEDTSGAGGAPEGSLPLELVDWTCADACASICRVRCAVACVDSGDPHCLQACYPVCRSDCYLGCAGPEPAEPDPIDPVIDPTRLLRDAGAP